MCASKDLDQFYTNPKIANQLFKKIERKIKLKDMFLLEPSAGNGSFSNLFNKYDFEAIDLDPKLNYIIKDDFFNYDYHKNINKKTITIGNPPFGKNSSLAVKFFNHASIFSEYICFILPKTFNKKNFLNRLNKNMFLIYSEDLEDNSFIFNNEKYNVPCVFQIWKRNIHKERKPYINKTSTELFEFTKKEYGTFAIRRVGGLAGKIFKEFSKYSTSSHYYIKSKELESDLLFKIINELFLELNNVSKNTAGNPSLSKDELIKLIETKLN